jgi:hypothetical protein
MNYNKSMQKPLLAAILILSLWQACRAGHSLPMSQATQSVRSDFSHRELGVIATGLAHALLQPDVSLVVLNPNPHTLRKVPHPLQPYVAEHARVISHFRSVEVVETLYGTAQVGGALFQEAEHPCDTFQMQEISEDRYAVAQGLANGSRGPLIHSSTPLLLGALTPLSTDRIWYKPAKDEFKILVASGSVASIPVFEAFHSWTLFPMASVGTATETSDQDIPRPAALPAEFLNDLRLISRKLLPGNGTAAVRAEYVRTETDSEFSAVRDSMTTTIGKLLVDELEILSSERIIPVGLNLAFQRGPSGAFRAARGQPNEAGLSALVDSNLDSFWGASDQGVPYELEFNLGKTYQVSFLQVDWMRGSKHAPIDILLSTDGGATYALVDRTFITEPADDATVVQLDGSSADRIKLRYNQYPVAEQRVWAGIAEVNLRYRVR